MRSRHRWIRVLALGVGVGVLGTGTASAATGRPAPASSAPPTVSTSTAAPGIGHRALPKPPPPSVPSTVAGAVEPTDSATPSAPSAEPTSSPFPSDGPSLSEEEKYWTADRMDNAVPLDSPPVPASAAAKHGIRAGAAAHRPPPAGTPAPEHFLGHPMVGTFFFDGQPLGGPKTYCTGSVVHTAAKDIVLTAGHCGLGLKSATHRIFVPRYRTGRPAAGQPDGVFPVSQLYIDPRYERNSKKAVSDLDLAFAQVGPNGRGKVEDVTGALTFTPTSGYRHKVTVIGYPGDAGVNPDHVPVRCPVSTSQLPGFRQMRMTCTGFYGGVSGGPWIEDYNSTDGTGKVIGNTGGYNGGGNDANDDWVTYAPVYGKDAQDLFADAAAHRKVADDKPPYRPSGDPWLPGTAATWKNAGLMASGDFRRTGHSDMIVVWSDGEVTLYPGDGHGGYDPERQLLPGNSTWKNAKTITAGDFTGSDQFDLLVRWVDGEVTLYGDVGSNGLDRPGTQMIKPNDLWKNATQIVAGRFAAARYVTDLVVRWSDGELTLYTGVGAGTFGQEHQLKPKNDTWRNATLLTAGEFSGDQKWDLMVRWVDGELDDYAGTTTSGLGGEHRILDPNGLWKHDAAMTTGDFTGNGRTDDLVIRWSDGETTMYTDTLADQLGAEHTLVAPTS